MQINISGKHLEITPAIEEYIHKKAERLVRHLSDRLQSVTFVIEKEPHRKGYHVEVKTDVAGHEDFIANQRHDDLYACIDLVMDRADRQITDWKSRIRDHRH